MRVTDANLQVDQQIVGHGLQPGFRESERSARLKDSNGRGKGRKKRTNAKALRPHSFLSRQSCICAGSAMKGVVNVE